MNLTKNEIEKLLCEMIYLNLQNNGGLLEDIISSIKGITPKETKYLKEIMNWEEE